MNKVLCFLCHKKTKPLSMMVDFFSKNRSNKIIIHVDSKSDINEFSCFSAYSNVILLSERHNVLWGGVGMVSATISLLKEALNHKFDYLFLLSGDDLVCVDERYLDDFLNNINLFNLIHYQDERNGYVNPDNRVKYRYPSFFFKKESNRLDYLRRLFFKLFKFSRINKEYHNFISSGHRFYKGSQWFGLNHKTVSDIILFLNENSWYLDLYRDSLIPDEVFFHTLIKYIGINDLYSDKTKVSDALRYTDWITGPDYPRSLDYDDVDKIKKSGCLFARKFKHDTSVHLFDELRKSV